MSANMFTRVSRHLGKGGVLVFNPSGKPLTLKLGYVPCATITRKANRPADYQRLPPFPYKEKKYTMFRSWFDRTSDRFDENSKIIVVDGPIAVGKSKFAQELAENLDFHYLPEANMDMVYINKYGFDQRSLNDRLPREIHRTDEKDFCRDPYFNTAYLQFAMFELRFSMYVDALAHLMNTGQGVVMVRSVYSDNVFAEAMAKLGYIRKPVLNGYYKIRNELLSELLRPHLQIYLDIPVDVVEKRIKERGNDYEINGKALSKPFLEAMEETYKKKILPEIETHSEMLIYDWSDYGDLELVVEDIERIDFDKYTVYDKKMHDWIFPREQALSDYRMTYTDCKEDLIAMMNIPLLDCPELYMSGESFITYEELIFEAPGNKYADGYNAGLGDTGVLFKMKRPKREYPFFN